MNAPIRQPQPTRSPAEAPPCEPAHVRIDFTVGSRRLASFRRELTSWRFALGDVLALTSGDAPRAAQAKLVPPAPGPEGWRVLSAPQVCLPAIEAQTGGYLQGSRQDYPRHYIDMAGAQPGGASDFEAYMARFSGKTRSTLRRKARKLEREASGIAISEHRTPAEIEDFLDHALPLSARTYQARLLDAGLPSSPQARRAMMEAAEAGKMRCFLLHAGRAGARRAIAYLSLPVEGRVLVYAHLGYDPDWARLSPGTVLQMEALERLYAESAFTHFDFTEGDGAHKAMFATHSVPCASFVMLRPSPANRALLGARGAFDEAVAGAKALAERSGILARARLVLRA